jgi:acyl-CoA synthetase (AMP-forming)/AMP-acid ligase II
VTNLARLVADSAAADAERPAIRMDDAVAPYGGLDQATRRVAGLLRAYVKDRVAAYKYPRRVWFVDALPKGPTGTIVKREIAVPESEPAARGS